MNIHVSWRAQCIKNSVLTYAPKRKKIYLKRTSVRVNIARAKYMHRPTQQGELPALHVLYLSAITANHYIPEWLMESTYFLSVNSNFLTLAHCIYRPLNSFCINQRFRNKNWGSHLETDNNLWLIIPTKKNIKIRDDIKTKQEVIKSSEIKVTNEKYEMI